MKSIYRTYKLRLYPTESQKVLIEKHFGCTRFVYNYYLNERKNQYEKNGKSDNLYAQTKKLVGLKKKEETKWLKEVNSQSLESAIRNMDSAYINFFRGRAKFPKFKSKKQRSSFTIPQFSRLKGNKFYAIKFKEGIKVRVHREMRGELKRSTLSKTATGKYFVAILCKEQYQPKEKTGRACGLDLGVSHYVVTSDGVKYENNRYTKKYEKKLTQAQRHLSRKIKGSKGFEKQKLKVASIYEKATNSRKDNMHKVVDSLISTYDKICIETLNVKGMLQNKNLAKHISDASWGLLVRSLEYKAKWNDKQILRVDRWFPSSKKCNKCGDTTNKLPLSKREWICSNGHLLDRDVNAAINILQEGIKKHGQELPITKVESELVFSYKAHSMKPETNAENAISGSLTFT